ncbi:MAG: sigma 54-interacting transcriptional regulator, partial [bacterium]
LRVLQQKNYETVGGTQTLTTNARVIAATHKDIFEEVQQGNFREDLAYRLNVINIQIPPLRDRSEDIPVLATALLDKAAQQMDIEKAHLSEAAMSALKHYPWPGNVRELENALTQALVHARGGEITPEQLHLRELDTAVTSQVETELPLQSLEQVEAAHIQKVLHHTRGHKGQSCEILGISRPALDRKIKKYDLKVG